MPVLKITLDTNCIINDIENKTNYVKQIKKLAEKGLIDLAITTRTISDKKHDPIFTRKQKHIKEFSKYKIIGTVFRIDSSSLNSGDFIIDNTEKKQIDRISEILLGKTRKNNTRFHNIICDIDHLIGHFFNKRDIFITSDKNFLKKSKRLRLKEEFNIVIENPKEFLKRFQEP